MSRGTLQRLARGLLAALGLLLAALAPGAQALAAPQALSFTVSNPVCTQTPAKTGICQINIRSISANSSDGTLLGVEIGINGKLRARINTFFENNAYLTQKMLNGGLQVPCGGLGAGGLPGYGQVYSVSVVAVLVGGTSSTDIASVACPAFTGTTYLPMMRR